MVIGTQKHCVLTFVKDSYLVKLEITGNLSKPKNDPLLFFSKCLSSFFVCLFCFALIWFFFSSSQWTMDDQIPWVLVFVRTCLPKIWTKQLPLSAPFLYIYFLICSLDFLFFSHLDYKQDYSKVLSGICIVIFKKQCLLLFLQICFLGSDYLKKDRDPWIFRSTKYYFLLKLVHPK